MSIYIQGISSIVISVILMCILIIGSIYPVASISGETEPVLTSVTTNKEIYEQNETIEIRITLTNVGNESIQLYSGAIPEEKIRIENQYGEVIYYYPQAVKWMILLTDLEVNHSISFFHNITHNFEPGFYTVWGKAYDFQGEGLPGDPLIPWNSTFIRINGTIEPPEAIASRNFNEGFIYGVTLTFIIVMAIASIYFMKKRRQRK